MKKGFTLIELIVSLSIIIVISICVSIPMKSIIDIQKQADVKKHLVEVDNMISFARTFCKTYESSGKLMFLSNTGECYFKAYDRVIKKCNIGKHLKYKSFNGDSSSVIELDGDGWLVKLTSSGNPQPMSIVMVDDEGHQYRISIRVGNYDEEIYKDY